MIGEQEASLRDNSEFSKRAGGAPANVAVAASRLGADVDMAATVGDDEFGDFLINRMKEEGVKIDRIRQVNRRTTLAFASLDEKARPHFMFYRDADEHLTREQLSSDTDIIHIGSLPFTNPETADILMDFVKESDTLISFDPNLREDLVSERYSERLQEIVHHVDILTAAEEEIDFFGGLEELSEYVDEIIITRGSDGAELVTPSGRYRSKAQEVNVVDTTGAGDALTGAYLRFREEGGEKALEKAVRAASISVTSKGAMTSLPRMNEVE